LETGGSFGRVVGVEKKDKLRDRRGGHPGGGGKQKGVEQKGLLCRVNRKRGRYRNKPRKESTMGRQPVGFKGWGGKVRGERVKTELCLGPERRTVRIPWFVKMTKAR